MADLTHLHALELRLSHERERLARDLPRMARDLRLVWARQIEREIEQEKRLLGIAEIDAPEMTDDEILAALRA